MSRLVLKGTTRGVAVIQLLVMLGAKSQYTGTFKGFYYWIEDGQVTSSDVPPENSIIFSLEEFEEKFPYKVGDKVIAYAEGCLAQFTIQEIRWNDELNKIEYRICSSWLDANLMWLYKEKKEETMEEKKINQMSLANCDLDEVEIVLGDKFEMEIKDGKYYAVKKKPQYPKTYKECCDIMHIEMNRIIYYEDGLDYRDITQYDINLSTRLKYFRRLLICRDAYWKIAGEQMGLDKPWKYDMSKNEFSCAISYEYGSIQKCEVRYRNHFLVFPTKEMRDAFYENFKELINECKELL